MILYARELEGRVTGKIQLCPDKPGNDKKDKSLRLVCNLCQTLVQYSITPEHVNTQPLQERVRTVLPTRHAFTIHPITVYEKRPATLESVTFYDYSQNYMTRKDQYKQTNQDHIYIGCDQSTNPLHVYTAKLHC